MSYHRLGQSPNKPGGVASKYDPNLQFNPSDPNTLYWTGQGAPMYIAGFTLQIQQQEGWSPAGGNTWKRSGGPWPGAEPPPGVTNLLNPNNQITSGATASAVTFQPQPLVAAVPAQSGSNSAMIVGALLLLMIPMAVFIMNKKPKSQPQKRR